MVQNGMKPLPPAPAASPDPPRPGTAERDALIEQLKKFDIDVPLFRQRFRFAIEDRDAARRERDEARQERDQLRADNIRLTRELEGVLRENGTLKHMLGAPGTAAVFIPVPEDADPDPDQDADPDDGPWHDRYPGFQGSDELPG
jgi:hypothetical protein